MKTKRDNECLHESEIIRIGGCHAVCYKHPTRIDRQEFRKTRECYEWCEDYIPQKDYEEGKA